MNTSILTLIRIVSITMLFQAVYALDNLIILTIPKSGTHLLEKALTLIDKDNRRFPYDEDFHLKQRYEQTKKMNRLLLPPDHYKGPLHIATVNGTVKSFKRMYSKSKKNYHTHIYYTDSFNTFLDLHGFKKILLLRDPRAVLVSFARMVQPGFEPHQTIDLEELLLDLIDCRQKHYIPWATPIHAAYPLIWEIGICDFYKLYLPFIGSRNCLTLRFENLVGDKGGGSNKRQVDNINKIAQHIGMTLNDAQMADITEQLFGNSTTFSQGQIDGWKKYFTPAVKQAFKTMPGANELLIELGYEKDSNW